MESGAATEARVEKLDPERQELVTPFIADWCRGASGAPGTVASARTAGRWRCRSPGVGFDHIAVLRAPQWFENHAPHDGRSRPRVSE